MGGGLIFTGSPPDHADSVDATGVVFKRKLASDSGCRAYKSDYHPGLAYMKPDIIAHTLTCLDTATPRPANQVGRMVWPDRKFNTQQAAGAAIRPILEHLAAKGIVRRGPQGWIKIRPETNS